MQILFLALSLLLEFPSFTMSMSHFDIFGILGRFRVVPYHIIQDNISIHFYMIKKCHIEVSMI